MTGDDVGTVSLVGSGPGDPDLSTVRTQELPSSADRVLHDELAGPAVLAEIPDERRENVGSRGHEAGTDRAALAETRTTIVVLMGASRLPDYTAALIEAGIGPETPVAMVERATWPAQQVATGTLATIVDERDAVGIEPPALTVVGEVSGLGGEVVARAAGERGGDA